MAQPAREQQSRGKTRTEAWNAGQVHIHICKVVLLPFLSLYSHLGPKEDFARMTINPFSHNDHLCQK